MGNQPRMFFFFRGNHTLCEKKSSYASRKGSRSQQLQMDQVAGGLKCEKVVNLYVYQMYIEIT